MWPRWPCGGSSTTLIRPDVAGLLVGVSFGMPLASHSGTPATPPLAIIMAAARFSIIELSSRRTGTDAAADDTIVPAQRFQDWDS